MECDRLAPAHFRSDFPPPLRYLARRPAALDDPGRTDRSRQLSGPDRLGDADAAHQRLAGPAADRPARARLPPPVQRPAPGRPDRTPAQYAGDRPDKWPG